MESGLGEREHRVRGRVRCFEEIDDGIWNGYFGRPKLCRFNERHMKIEDDLGRLRRQKV